MPTPKKNTGLKYRKAQSIKTINQQEIIKQLEENNLLTVNQVSFLEYLLDCDKLPPTYAELCEKANISFQSFSLWKKEEEFVKQFAKALLLKHLFARPWVDEKNRELAKEGDKAHAKLFYELIGALNQTPQMQVNQQINYSEPNKVG